MGNEWQRFCNPKNGESYEDCQKRLIEANNPESRFPTESQKVEIESRVNSWSKKP
jgi:hypothetical protein